MLASGAFLIENPAKAGDVAAMNLYTVESALKCIAPRASRDRIRSDNGRLAIKMQSEDARKALSAQANAVWESANSKSPIEMDRNDLYAAWQSAQARLTWTSKQSRTCPSQILPFPRQVYDYFINPSGLSYSRAIKIFVIAMATEQNRSMTPTVCLAPPEHRLRLHHLAFMRNPKKAW
jgi:hypothetical protein